MHIEIHQPHGGLWREYWRFWLSMSSGDLTLWLDAWVFEARESTRHRKWHRQSCWYRVDKRDNTEETVYVPNEVVRQAKAMIAQRVEELPITY